MGSYDSGEYTSAPRRRISERLTSRRPATSPTYSAPTQETTASQGGSANAPREAIPEPQTNYDPGLQTIAALGGGLSSDRIIKPLPDDIKEGTLLEVIAYMTRPDVVSTKEETRVLGDITQRQRKDDYRCIVNEFHNLHNSKLGTDKATMFYQNKTMNQSGQSQTFNYLDMAVISHDECGTSYDGLEKKCK